MNKRIRKKKIGVTVRHKGAIISHLRNRTVIAIFYKGRIAFFEEHGKYSKRKLRKFYDDEEPFLKVLWGLQEKWREEADE